MQEKDPVIRSVRSDLTFWSKFHRENGGMERTGVPTRDWIRYAYEESVRTAIYLKRVLLDLAAAELDEDRDISDLLALNRHEVQMSIRTNAPPDPQMPAPIDLDPDLRVVLLREGGRVRLPYKEFLMLQVLVQRHGTTVSKDSLVQALWGFGDPPLTADQALAVYVYKLRQKLAGHIRLVSVRGDGYRLFYADEDFDAADASAAAPAA